MHALDRFDEDDNATVFRDVILLALAGFVCVVILLLPHIHTSEAAAKAGATIPGNVMIEANWPVALDADVDLWVQGPGDIPVGYSNKGGLLFDLLRDDLGTRLDASGLNYEVSYSRGIVAGEYAVNLHLYRNRARTYPVTATVVVSVKTEGGNHTKQILVSDLDLRREGEERTVFRFELDAQGRLVPGSVHSLMKPLRSGTKS